MQLGQGHDIAISQEYVNDQSTLNIFMNLYQKVSLNQGNQINMINGSNPVPVL